jgi:hypothetical protein
MTDLAALKEPTYICIAPCGCIRAAFTVEDKSNQKIWREIRRALASGYEVKMVEAEVVRTTMRRCTHETDRERA